MKLTSLLTITSLLITPIYAISDTLTDDQKTAIDRLVQQTVEAANIPSAVVLIDRGGETIYEMATGKSNLEHDIQSTPETAYAIGSITKSFTALAILQLVHDGKIALDSPLATYLPGYEGPGAAVTVEQLLAHTSGIPNYTSEIPGIKEGLKRTAYSREEMVGFFEHLSLHYEAGSLWNYTNSGYYMLGLIVEAVSGLDYYDYLQQNILDPLEMTRTYRGDDSEIIPMRASGYELGKNGYVNAPTWYYLVPFSAGSLVSTVGDIVKYRRGVFHSEHFPPALRKLLLQKPTLAGGETSTYALGGLVISDFEGHEKISHAGDIWGFASNHSFYPKEDITIVILLNRQIGAPAVSSIESKIARVVFNIPQPDIRDLDLGDEILQRYTGDFKLYPYLVGGGTFGFIARDGKLHIRFGGTEAKGPAIPLLAQGDGIFRASFDDEWLFRFIGEEGQKKADRLDSWYRDGLFSATRLK
jgi:D-alanyl-D-alanine carboxypeptidase